jgi:hypothetical protein
MTRDLAELLITALGIHHRSFVPDPGCEVSGSYAISIHAASRQACEGSGLPRWGPVLGLMLDLALDAEPDIEILIEQIREAAK